jgi:hypothetical protein
VGFVSRGLCFLCLVALAGCGAPAQEPSGPEYVNKADLAIMVVPREELGALATGLEVAPDESGWASHKKAANDTLDPEDSAASLSARGRVAGYDLTYENPKAKRRKGLLFVGTSVVLLRDEIYASEYLNKQVNDFERREGLSDSGVRLSRVGSFEVPGVGDEGEGVRATMDVAGRKVRYTLAFFRRGRIVGAAGFVRGDKRRVSADALAIAKALDLRIRAVLSGEVEGDPVPLS